MKIYQNLSGKSTITFYEIGQQRIVVQYKNGSAHLYNQATSESLNFDIMKDLAQTGLGLHTFITRFVDNSYWSQLN